MDDKPFRHDSGKARRPIFIVAGEPESGEEQDGFFARLLEAAAALARAAFSRHHPVAILGDERLLPVLLAISTEYLDPDLDGTSVAQPWIYLYGEPPEPWREDFLAGEEAGLARQNFTGNDAQALDAVLRTGELQAAFILGGGAERIVRRLRGDERRGVGRLPVFLIRSVGGATDLADDDNARVQLRDADALKEVVSFLRELGLEEDMTDVPEQMSLLYPLIMQTFLDRLDG